MDAAEIAQDANDRGILGLEAFLDWAARQGIECGEYDDDAVMLFDAEDSGDPRGRGDSEWIIRFQDGRWTPQSL